MQKPLITIVTVSFNDLDNLVKTAQTIFDQTYENIEYIIVDGGSTDGTIEFIKNNESKISRWVSEKDNGIYDAMNKGIAMATGDFICLMNCGDYLLASDIIEIVAQKICDENVDSNSIVYTNYMRKGMLLHQPKKWLGFYFYVRPLNHQATYVGKKAYEKIGGFDLSYPVGADHEHQLRSYKNKIPFIHCDCVSFYYMADGFSLSPKSRKVYSEELKKMRKTYFTKKQRALYFILYHLTFPKIRSMMTSEKSSPHLKNFYKKIRLFATNIIGGKKQ